MSWTQTIEDHYERNWRVAPEVCPFELGPIHELPKDFRVLAFPPHRGRTIWTYATCGMSSRDDAIPIELHLFSPIQSNEVVELLFAVAHFHRTGSRLDLWHTVNFGRPWLGTSQCTFGLVSLPYLDGPELETIERAEGSAKFYWLIPITRSEQELKKSAGIEALETRFESAGFDYADPLRSSVV